MHKLEKCHDLTKQLSYYFILFYFISFLDLLHKEEVQKSDMSQVSHHSHKSGDVT